MADMGGGHDYSFCNAFSQAVLSEYDAYAELDMHLTEGRNLHVLPNLRKFKFKVIPNGWKMDSRPWTVYMVSTDPGAVFTPPKFTSAAIYPVMIVSPDGIAMQNTTAINELFTSTKCCQPAESVMSVMEYLCQIELLYNNTTTAYNDAKHDFNFLSFLSRWDSLVVLTNCVLSESYMLSDASAYRVNTPIPEEVIYMLSCRSTGGFDHMINWYACTNDPSCQATWQAAHGWPKLYEGLRNSGIIFHTSTDVAVPVIPSGVSRIGTVINLLYSVNAEDFWFDLNTSPEDVPGDVYCKTCYPSEWFYQIQTRMTPWRDLVETMNEAMNLIGTEPCLSQMCAHRTFLDELVLYYKTDLTTPVLWMDAFWWSLASSPGLINASNINNLTI